MQPHHASGNFPSSLFQCANISLCHEQVAAMCTSMYFFEQIMQCLYCNTTKKIQIWDNTATARTWSQLRKLYYLCTYCTIIHIIYIHICSFIYSYYQNKIIKCQTVGLHRNHESESILINPYPTAFPYGNGMVLHFYQQQESSTTKTVHKVINKGLKTYV